MTPALYYAAMTRRRLSYLITAAILVIVFAALLALDLSQRGLAWRIFYDLTGEEAPLAQVRGMVEWAGNLTRPQPNTDANIPISHAGVNPLGINTFLQQEVEPARREQQLQMIADAGFVWIRQQFPWEDIEIHGRGDFTDRRNDLNGDGTPDPVDAWIKYDNIVDLAEQYGVQIIARLDAAPNWSHADPQEGTFPPPDDFQDYVNYAVAVATRYQGRILYYQIWNEPNIYPEWGTQPVNPEAYTEMLCRTYTALKAVAPEIVVIAGALSPTLALSPMNLSEFVYLQRMYDAGAADCFDVMSVQGYGFYSGPTDQRLRTTTLNFGRHTYVRDIMVANGDADKAIWISEAAWNPVNSPDVSPDVVGRENFGAVTQEQAAAYMPQAYERAESDWPWLGVVNYWFFKRATDTERNLPFYYFRMVEPDFTPLPVYEAMRNFDLPRVLYHGVHQADHWAITGEEAVPIQTDAGAQFGEASLVESAPVNAYGTHVTIRWKGERLQVFEIVDAIPIADYVSPNPDEWTETEIHASLWATTVRYGISSDAPFLLDSITVSDRTIPQLTPIVGTAVALLITGIGAMVGYLWRKS
ncbi:MAG: cellulase family glycosylhydrolase [Chloroflexi bacterium]|uniref:cellulase family glycosylhydrolase n=1 Tax=Candidatus Flexifilum breve TaxID=3140694 RepID=UPI003135B0CF|nr:cellulase family glycosylhydrolase [Chloroflexota bacterium]